MENIESKLVEQFENEILNWLNGENENATYIAAILVEIAKQEFLKLNKPAVINCKIMAEIYELPLHKCTEVNTGASTFNIVRVAGGWLYTIYRLDSNQMTTTFVPFNDEYMSDK